MSKTTETFSPGSAVPQIGVVDPLCNTMPLENKADSLTSARAGSSQRPFNIAPSKTAEKTRRMGELLVAKLKDDTHCRGENDTPGKGGLHVLFSPASAVILTGG